MKNIQLVSSDSEQERRLAEYQPYVEVPQTVVTSCRSVQLEDGSTEHAPEHIEGGERIVVPGRELRENMQAYGRRVEAAKEVHPKFVEVVGGSDVPIPRAVHDQILKMPNGPDIVFFLAHYPDVVSELFDLSPFDAADQIEEISQVLSKAQQPGDALDYEEWRRLRTENVERKKYAQNKK